MAKKKDIITWVETGNCPVDITEALKQWDERHWIAQWGHGDEATYRLIKYRQLWKESVTIKATIAPAQAKELIEKLGLISVKEMFASATSWKYVSDDSFVYGLFATNRLNKSMSGFVDYEDKKYVLNRLAELEKNPKKFVELIKKHIPQYYIAMDNSVASITLMRDLNLLP